MRDWAMSKFNIDEASFNKSFGIDQAMEYFNGFEE